MLALLPRPRRPMVALATACFAFVTATLLARSPAAETRTWTDSTGQHRIEAQLVDVRDGMVRLRKTDGLIVSMAADKLSSPDQQYLKQQAAGEAEIEFVSGTTSRGTITERDAQYITVEFNIGGRRLQRKYPTARIHAITIGGRREVLNEKTAAGPPRAGNGSSHRPGNNAAGNGQSSAQIEALVDRVGREKPDWWDDVPLDYPESLDLAWPQPPPNGWNSQRNIGQYVWDVINPNPSKWRSGARFMHHLLERSEGNPQLQQRIMNELGRMYGGLLQDYPRAIFWWRKAGVETNPRFVGNAVRMAGCYWKLGNKQMAMQTLGRLRSIHFSALKLMADMGETQQVVQMIERIVASQPVYADIAYLIAGDARRIEGRYEEAVAYYQKVLAARATGNAQKRVGRNQQRARTNIEAIRIFDSLDLSKVADGTYRGESPAYAGPLQVEVTVASGRIASVRVVAHREKQFYSALTDTPKQIVARQGVEGVDAVTGATITSEAIINATAKGLAKGLQ